jgi:hypothetical protein
MGIARFRDLEPCWDAPQVKKTGCIYWMANWVGSPKNRFVNTNCRRETLCGCPASNINRVETGPEV